ncbi:efflux transporter outer membrane subunit [Pseudomonas oryzihabitans]|uniref:efflux transporter outer membrane subunit n=1 Tax=Pseudomonas oryzihabitans TaxID=47885 RepID=UPI00289575CA|nr:efflux transporter outer membrane subunit [Pseudomonas oryzihabitans]MDT3720683.1 efflux transporter outer membrane subunit [Pseudomonas oryzihabitans]
MIRVRALRMALLSVVSGGVLSFGIQAQAGTSLATPPPIADGYVNAVPGPAGVIPELDQWWHRFDDPVLDRLVQIAVADNLDLKSAVSRIEAARALSTAAASGRKPRIDLGAGVGRERVPSLQSWTSEPTTAWNNSLDLGISWELDVFGRIRQGVTAAQADVVSASEDAHAVQVAVIGEVVRNYLEVRGLEQRLDVTHRNVRNQEDTERFMQQMFEVGEVPGADLDRARTQREITAAELPALELQRQQALHRLSVLLAGTAQQAYELLVPAPIPMHPALPADAGIPADLLRLRPDIRAAEARVIAAYARVGVAEADLRPQLRLAGMLGAVLDGFSGATFARSVAWMAGANASAPLFDGKRRRSVVALRRAEAEQALNAYRQAVLEAVSEVETALAAATRHRVRVEGLERATASARSAYVQIDRSWRSGESAFIDTLEVQRTLLAAEDALAQSRTMQLQSQADLMVALGRGSVP